MDTLILPKGYRTVTEVKIENFNEFNSLPIKSLYEVEKEHVLNTLAHFNGSKTATATALGITLKTLYNKLHQYGAMNKE